MSRWPTRRRPARAMLALGAVLLATGLAACTSEPDDGITGGPASPWTSGSGTDPGTPAPDGTATSGTPTPGPSAQPGSSPVGVKWDWSRYSEFEPYLQTLKGA